MNMGKVFIAIAAFLLVAGVLVSEFSLGRM